ncbi:hypothetical protein HNQ58_001334 [Rehaibacterium terrae]|uniref:Uncharacterized protein n=1 Tax=Rehaibacterium terrae TaxID=1341696 RepID=A0A7W8DDZ9_9GAMM|nr:hypothetical protein [Rehaibacterium terrae]
MRWFDTEPVLAALVAGLSEEMQHLRAELAYHLVRAA